MDSRVAALPAVVDGDLAVCDGVAYQVDMNVGRVAYDGAYLAKVDCYADTSIAAAVNAGRCSMLMRHMDHGASVLDIGAGSGAFVRCAVSWGFAAKGYDVMPGAVARLRAEGLYADPEPAAFDAVTLWDTMEHMEDPADLLSRVPADLFVSLPIFSDLRRIRSSRHYRPGEHLYYWTADGLVAWMAAQGFRLLEQSGHEVAAGRDAIGAFAFRRA